MLVCVKLTTAVLLDTKQQYITTSEVFSSFLTHKSYITTSEVFSSVVDTQELYHNLSMCS